MVSGWAFLSFALGDVSSKVKKCIKTNSENVMNYYANGWSSISKVVTYISFICYSINKTS